LKYLSLTELNANKSHFKRLTEVAESLIDWNDGTRCRHFSFIVYKKRIIAIGTNKPKTHPTNLINRKISVRTGEDFSDQKHVCSEFNAITKLKRLTNINTKKCTLVNLRYDRNQKLNLSCPCMSCKNLLRYFEFKNVFYSDAKGNFQMLK
jgi:deoxycytidylate deaminase